MPGHKQGPSESLHFCNNQDEVQNWDPQQHLSEHQPLPISLLWNPHHIDQQPLNRLGCNGSASRRESHMEVLKDAIELLARARSITHGALGK